MSARRAAKSKRVPPATAAPHAPQAAEASCRLSRKWRCVISVLVLWHLWAVLGEPVEFITRQPFGLEGSPAGEAFNAPVQPYAEFLYLNHGYAFFAPDPGPSHLMEVTWTDESGELRQELFPDLSKQWPRLLYHRHFMLTEFLHNVHAPQVPEELDPASDLSVSQWQASREQYEAIRDSIARHLAGRYGVPFESITVERVEHRQPLVPEYLRGGVRLRDPQLYRTLPDVVTGPPGESPAGEAVPGPGPLSPGPLVREPGGFVPESGALDPESGALGPQPPLGPLQGPWGPAGLRQPARSSESVERGPEAMPAGPAIPDASGGDPK